MPYIRHGMTDHPFLRVWKNMIQRATNPKSRSYKNYGGRGIGVCDRWMSFINFREDMYATYRSDLFLDRRDNNGPYSPENCRWVTRVEQNSNRRQGAAWDVGKKSYSTNTSGFVGVMWHKRQKRWVSRAMVNGKQKQIGSFRTPEEAAAAYRRFRGAIRENT